MPGRGSSGRPWWGWVTVPLLLVATVGAAGCSHLEGAPAAVPATIHPAWPGCDPLGAFQEPQPTNPFETGAVPAAFEPAAVVLCVVQDRGGAGGTDEQIVDVERRATEITSLLTYLARPSQRSTDPDLSCPAMAWLRPWLFLVDADGRWVTPQLPTDACGFPVGLFDGENRPLPYDSLPYTDRVIRTRSR